MTWQIPCRKFVLRGCRHERASPREPVTPSRFWPRALTGGTARRRPWRLRVDARPAAAVGLPGSAVGSAGELGRVLRVLAVARRGSGMAAAPGDRHPRASRPPRADTTLAIIAQEQTARRQPCRAGRSWCLLPAEPLAPDRRAWAIPCCGPAHRQAGRVSAAGGATRNVVRQATARCLARAPL